MRAGWKIIPVVFIDCQDIATHRLGFLPHFFYILFARHFYLLLVLVFSPLAGNTRASSSSNVEAKY